VHELAARRRPTSPNCGILGKMLYQIGLCQAAPRRFALDSGV
jgi:hypothetical protein